MLFTLPAVSVCIWLYLLLGRGAFWLEPLRLNDGETPVQARVIAVVPARNEAAVIARSLQSLLDQGIDVILVDDASTDDTVAIARSLPNAGRLTILQAPPLPPGWTGKLWAVQQGIDSARELAPDYVLLTDADIEHTDGSIETLVGIASREGTALTTWMARLHCRTFAERALIPAFVFFFFMLYPPRWIRDPRRRLAGAAGGCMLVEARRLFDIEGVFRIRGNVIDDCALAREIKEHGGNVWLGLTNSVRSIRPYQGFGEIFSMIARTAYTQLRYSPLVLAGTVAGMFATYIAPVALLGPTCGVGWLLMCVAYAPMLRFYNVSPLWAPFLPVIGAFYTAATVYSAGAYYAGRGGAWKGRHQVTPKHSAR